MEEERIKKKKLVNNQNQFQNQKLKQLKLIHHWIQKNVNIVNNMVEKLNEHYKQFPAKKFLEEEEKIIKKSLRIN